MAAYGVHLDRLGKLVGEPRLDRTDAPYAAAIRVRILVNRSAGTPDDLLKIAQLLVPAASIRYSEPGPSGRYELTSDSASADVYAALYKALRQADAAGVGSAIVLGSGSNTIVFGSSYGGATGRARGSSYGGPVQTVAGFSP